MYKCIFLGRFWWVSVSSGIHGTLLRHDGGANAYVDTALTAGRSASSWSALPVLEEVPAGTRRAKLAVASLDVEPVVSALHVIVGAHCLAVDAP